MVPFPSSSIPARPGLLNITFALYRFWRVASSIRRKALAEGEGQGRSPARTRSRARFISKEFAPVSLEELARQRDVWPRPARGVETRERGRPKAVSFGSKMVCLQGFFWRISYPKGIVPAA